jgi:hypothetical protein
MKLAVTSALTLDWGSGFIPVDWPAEVTQAEQLFSFTSSTLTPPWTVPALTALRI